jgi:hypothetical protein
MALKREMLLDRPKHERNFCVRFGSRKPRTPRRKSPWDAALAFACRLVAVLCAVVQSAAALTNTCFTFASSGISAFAPG